jgi:hypothetical protein
MHALDFLPLLVALAAEALVLVVATAPLWPQARRGTRGGTHPMPDPAGPPSGPRTGDSTRGGATAASATAGPSFPASPRTPTRARGLLPGGAGCLPCAVAARLHPLADAPSARNPAESGTCAPTGRQSPKQSPTR